jgi:hypothetical protein
MYLFCLTGSNLSGVNPACPVGPEDRTGSNKSFYLDTDPPAMRARPPAKQGEAARGTNGQENTDYKDL